MASLTFSGLSWKDGQISRAMITSAPRASWILDIQLRGDEMLAAVDMRAEFNAFVIDFPQAGQAENLETAAVGQNSPVPVHETVQPAHLADDIDPRPEVEVIGIGEYHLDADFFKMLPG